MNEEVDYLFKLVMVGDDGVGKTALTNQLSTMFPLDDFYVKIIKIDTVDGPIKIKLGIQNIKDYERVASLLPLYYIGSLGILIIFDLTSYDSFENLPHWVEEVRANINNEIPILLVGNKNDLIHQRTVTIEEINDFTSKFDLYYMETSAKIEDSAGDCFYNLALLIMETIITD